MTISRLLDTSTTNRSVSSSTLGRPQDLRYFDPSNLLTMSFRYQASSVSGFATAANSSKAFRPSRWAISANVAFSASDNNNLPLIWALRMRVLCGQIFVPQKKFLVYGSGDVSKHASPNHSRASLNLIVEPGLYMLLRFQKPAVRGNYETGNQAFSMHLRFFTIRETPWAYSPGHSFFRENTLTRKRSERSSCHSPPIHGSRAATERDKRLC